MPKAKTPDKEPSRRSSPAPSGDWHAGLREAGPYLGLGMQLAFTMLFFVGVGYLVDRRLGTLPLFLIIGAVVGMTALFIQLFRVSAEMSAQAKAERERRQAARRRRERGEDHDGAS
ncbi:AtpZ/AtpI family protein [Rhodocaloribacter sp.]